MSRRAAMRHRALGLTALLLLLAAGPAAPQAPELSLEEAWRAGEQFLRENLDDDLLAHLEQLDSPAAAAFFKSFTQQLHGRFKDWKLALAAYNAGEGRVARLLQTRRAKTFEAIAPALPAETQMYVPKFAATLLKREGLTLAQLPAPKS